MRRAVKALIRRLPVVPGAVLAHYTALRGHDAAAGAGCSEWRDQSQGQRHQSQATGANQPIFQPLGTHGQPALRSDGTADRMRNTSGGAPFHGRTQGTYLMVFAAALQNDRYFLSQPEATAGTNGVDVRVDGFPDVRCITKTDTSSIEENFGLPYSSAGRPVALESGVDLTKTGQEVYGTGSDATFNYGNLSGSTMDASGGELALFAFSGTGFFQGAAIDLHEIALVERPLSAGERRRWYRYCTRRYAAKQPYGRWHDGTLTLAL